MRGIFGVFAILFMILSPAVLAGEADVVAVEVAKQRDGKYRFDVTVRHADEGWEHKPTAGTSSGRMARCSARGSCCIRMSTSSRSPAR